MKKLLSAREVGELLGVTEDTARKYIRQKMTFIMLPGGDLRVEESVVEAWAASQRTAPKETQTTKPRIMRMPYPAELFEPDGRIKRRRSTP